MNWIPWIVVGAVGFVALVTLVVIVSRPPPEEATRPEPPPTAASKTSPATPPPAPKTTAPAEDPARVAALEEKWAAFPKLHRGLPWTEMGGKWTALRRETGDAPGLADRIEHAFGFVAGAWSREHALPPSTQACRFCWGRAVEKWCLPCGGRGTVSNPDNPRCGACGYAKGLCPSCGGARAHEWMARTRCTSCAGRGLAVRDGITPCPRCKATGLAPGQTIETHEACPFCRGRGNNDCVMCALARQLRSACTSCDGSGWMAPGGVEVPCSCRRRPKDDCRYCAGTGRMKDYEGSTLACVCVNAADPSCAACRGRGAVTSKARIRCAECLLRKSALPQEKGDCLLCGSAGRLRCETCGTSGKILRVEDRRGGFVVECVTSCGGSIAFLRNGSFVTFAGCELDPGRAMMADNELDGMLTGALVRVEPAGPPAGGALPAYVFVRSGKDELFVNAWLIERRYATAGACPDGRYDELLKNARR